jgi:GNAT superfamily N-acetyltransferase
MMAIEDNAVGAPLKTVTLRDGSGLILRLAQESDAERLLNLAKNSSASTMYSILFKSPHAGSRATVEHYTRTDDPLRCTILAEIVLGKEGALIQARPLVGIAHFWRMGRDAANLIIAVGGPWQGLGVGKALLTELTARAAADGVRRFHAVFGQDNAPMLALLNKCGLEVRLLPGAEDQWEILLNKNVRTHQGATL